MKKILVLPIFVALIFAFIMPAANGSDTIGKVNDKFYELDSSGKVIMTKVKLHHIEIDTTTEDYMVIEKNKYTVPNPTGHVIIWNFANTGLLAQSSFPDQDETFPQTTDWQIKISANGDATFIGKFNVLIG